MVKIMNKSVNAAVGILLTILFGSLFTVEVFAQSKKNSHAKLNSEESIVTELRNKAIKSDLAYDILESLTTEVGARMAGTPQDEKAVKWAVAKFESLGFDKVWTEPVKFKTWRRGKEAAKVVAPFPHNLVVTALGHSVGTSKKGIEASVIQFNSIEELIAAPAGIAKGKIVFISKKMERYKNGRGYGPAVKARRSGASEAAKKGAVAVIIRSIGTDSHRFAHTGMLQYKPGVKKIPAAAISNPDADLLVRLFSRKKPVKVFLKLGAHEGPEYTSYNVIAEMKGTTLPQQKVIIGGHLDSWDLGTGAVDDGAGVAITMAAAKLIGDSKKRPKRTIRVVLWANEEQGIIGAIEYAKAHKKDLANHMTGAESDFGAGKIYEFSSSVAKENLPMVEKMKRLMKPLGISYKDNEAGPGPDLIPLHYSGMSVFSLKQDGTDYFDLHHTADDTFDKVDPKNLAQNVAAYVVFAYVAANSEKKISIGKMPSREH